MSRSFRASRRALSTFAAAVFTFGVAGPASAAEPLGVPSGATADTPSEQPATSPVPAVVDPAASLRADFDSLSAALVERFAASAGVDVDTFVAANRQPLLELLPSGALDSPELAALPVSARISASLFDAANYEDLVVRLRANAHTPDALVVNRSVAGAAQLTRLPVPELADPGLIDGGALLSRAGPEGTLFGLVMNQSLVDLMRTAPDTFALVQESGLADPRAQDAWQRSLNTATARVAASPASTLPGPCYAALLAAIGSGDPNLARSQTGVGDGCNACLAAGSFLHSSMNRVLAPGSNSRLQISDDNQITPLEWSYLTDWQRAAIEAANPELRGRVARASELQAPTMRAVDDCGSSRPAAASVVGHDLGSILSRLNG